MTNMRLQIPLLPSWRTREEDCVKMRMQEAERRTAQETEDMENDELSVTTEVNAERSVGGGMCNRITVRQDGVVRHVTLLKMSRVKYAQNLLKQWRT